MNASERIINAIRAYTEANGYPPSIRDIQRITGLGSYGGLCSVLHRMAGEGKITYEPGKQRTIRISKAS